MIVEWAVFYSLPWNNWLKLMLFFKKSLKKIESEFESNELVDM
jgi:hypothetical protein